MAKQDHPFPFSGRLGKLTFFRSKLDGPMVRERRGVSKDRLLNDPKFKNTREAMAEFGRAGKAGKLVRKTIREQLLDVSDGRLISRLIRQLMVVIHTDAINDSGARTVAHGDITTMKDFEFNSASLLKDCLLAPFTTNIDRVTGKLTVTIPSFVPVGSIKAPQNSTHFKVSVTGAAFDFEAYTQEKDFHESGLLLLDGTPTQPQVFEQQLSANSTGSLFLFVGISFYKEILNGSMQKLNNGAFNALSIVDVNSH
jgi:hypothetical protein